MSVSVTLRYGIDILISLSSSTPIPTYLVPAVKYNNKAISTGDLESFYAQSRIHVVGITNHLRIPSPIYSRLQRY